MVNNGRLLGASKIKDTNEITVKLNNVFHKTTTRTKLIHQKYAHYVFFPIYTHPSLDETIILILTISTTQKFQ